MAKQHKSLTVFSDGVQNILPFIIGISEATSDRESAAIKTYRALWDTGATGSLITKKVADDLNIRSIGPVQVSTASGTTLTNSYLINLYLPNKVEFRGFKVSEGNLGGSYDVLIGMDVISLGDFAINNFEGKTSYSFRVPSLEFVDYERKPPPTRQQYRQMQRDQIKRIEALKKDPKNKL